jgi:hypothetical protein
MASPGGWMSSGPAYSTENNLRYCRLLYNQVETLSTEAFLSASGLPDNESTRTSSIHILESCGGVELSGEKVVVGFNAPRNFVMEACSQWRIPSSFVQSILKPGSLPRFEYSLELSPLKAINIGFRWGSGHDNFIIAFGRYEVATSSLNMMLSWRDILDYKALDCNMLDFCSVSDLMKAKQSELQRSPLLLIGFLLECCQQYTDLKAQQYDIQMLETGQLLKDMYTQNMTKWVIGWEIEAIQQSERKIDLIYANHSDACWVMKSCKELIHIGKQYLQLTDELRRTYHYEIPQNLVQSVVHCTELRAPFFDYLEKMNTAQLSCQKNNLVEEETRLSRQIAEDLKRIANASKRDSEAMKTISGLTLFFLPATFVSAVFSAGVFNLQNWDGAVTNPPVVSPGCWVFFLSCALATLLTLGTRFLWQRRCLNIQNALKKPDDGSWC